MNHQERIELLQALAQVGVSHYKSHDLEIHFGKPSIGALRAPENISAPSPQAPEESKEATEKLKELIESFKLNDDQLLDKIFPAGAGG